MAEGNEYHLHLDSGNCVRERCDRQDQHHEPDNIPKPAALCDH